VPAISIPHR